jgi:hypothetical protein
VTKEQELIIRASDLFVDASNAFTDLHDIARHRIISPYDPVVEIAEIYQYQLKPLFILLASDYNLDITVKTSLKLRSFKHLYSRG